MKVTLTGRFDVGIMCREEYICITPRAGKFDINFMRCIRFLVANNAIRLSGNAAR